jgi:Flp pilus assembly protein TadG
MKRLADHEPRKGRPTGSRRAAPVGLVTDERGVSAVEFAFVAPILFLLCIGIFQFGMLMFSQNTLQNVARDTSRRVAIGDIKAGDAAAWVATQLPGWIVGANTKVSTPTAADPEVRIAITAPMTTAAIVDPLGLFKGRTMSAAASARAEWL